MFSFLIFVQRTCIISNLLTRTITSWVPRISFYLSIFNILWSYVFTVVKDKHFSFLKSSFLCTVSGQTHQKPSAFEIFSHVIRWSSVTTIKHLHSCRLHENFAPEAVTSCNKPLNLGIKSCSWQNFWVCFDLKQRNLSIQFRNASK